MTNWIDIPTKEQAEIFIEWPDKFRMSYVDLYNIGRPDMQAHYTLWDELRDTHGGNPKAYKYA